MARVSVSTIASIHCSSEPGENNYSTWQEHLQTSLSSVSPFAASSSRIVIRQNALICNDAGGEVTEFLQAVCAARILGCRSCLPVCLLVCLVFCLHFSSGWSISTAIDSLQFGLPSLSIMSACLSVFVCSNADCNWFILCSVDCVCSLSVCVCGCLIINWSNWFIHQSLITPAYKDHPAPQPTAVLQYWWHDLWTFLWHLKYKRSELLSQWQIPYSFLSGGRGRHLYRWPEAIHFLAFFEAIHVQHNLWRFSWKWAQTLRRISRREPARKRPSRDIAELFKLLFDVQCFLFFGARLRDPFRVPSSLL